MMKAKKSKQTNSFFNSNQFYIIAISLLFFLIYLSIYDDKIDLNGDNMGYFASAQNLSSGKGFSYAFDATGAKLAEPIGYPLIVAAVMLFTKNFAVISFVNALFVLGSILLLYFICLLLGIPRIIWLLAAIFTILNATIMRYSFIHMSEASFIFFSLLGIYFYYKLDLNGRIEKQKEFYFMLAACLIGFFIRSGGVVLLLALLIALAWNKKIIATGIAVVFFLIPITIWNTRSQGENRYITAVLAVNPYDMSKGKITVTSAIDRIIENIDRYTRKEIPYSIFGFLQKINDPTEKKDFSLYALGLIIVLLSLFGILYKFSWQDSRLLLFLYLAGTMVMLLCWPTQWFGPRFIIPILPLIILFFLKGIYDLTQWLAVKYSMKPLTYVFYSLFLFIPLFIGRSQSNVAEHKNNLANARFTANARYTPPYQNYFNLGKWAKTNLPANSIVATRKPTLFYHTFGGYTMFYPTQVKNYQEFFDGLKSAKATHLVVDELGYGSSRFLNPIVETNPQFFTLLHSIENPSTRLYKINYPQ